MVNSYNFDYQYFDDLEFVLFFVIAPACVFIYKKNVVSLQRKLVAYSTSNKQQAEEILIKNLFIMKKIFTLFVLVVIASTNVFAAPISSGELFATYQKQGDTFYKGEGEANLAAGSFEWAVNYYIVSCGDSVLLRATTTEDKNLDNEWQTQLRIWENEYNKGNEVQVDAGDNKNRYTSSCRRITPSASDLKIHLFLSWEGYCTTQTFAYNRSSINNPIEDAVAPSINPEEVTMEEVGDKLVFTFGAATADDAYFYYVGDKEHNLGGISLTNKVYITKPTIKDGTTYSFKCYAVDYNGNKSDYKEFTLSMDFDPSLNLALNKPCTGGYCQFGGGTPEGNASQYVKANDGNTTNDGYSAYGAPSTEDAWWQVDLGMAYDVTQVKVFWANDYSNGFNIYGSLNGTDWVLIGTDAAKAANEVTETAVIASTRYIKIHSYNKKDIVMYEVEVYGTGIAVADATKPTASVACTDKTITSATLQINAADKDDNGNAGIVTSIKVSDIANEFAEVEVISLLDGDNKVTLSGLKDNTTYNFNIIVIDRAGNTTTEIIEVVLPFNTNLNLALGGTAADGYHEGDGYAADKAIDGNADTKWNTWGVQNDDVEDGYTGDYANNWMSIDLGAAYDLSNIKLSFDWVWDYVITEYLIEGSLDGSNWYILAHITDQATNAADLIIDASAQYVRFRAITKQALGIKEFEVYGTGFSTMTDALPIITFAQVGTITDNSAEIEISAADITTSPITQYVVTGADEAAIELTATDNKIVITGLAQSTTYAIQVQAKDNDGNLSAPQQLTFTTIGSVSGLYMFSDYFGWGVQTQERARFSNTAVEGVMVLTINNMTVGDHNFKLYNATDDRCTMGDCGGVSDHYIATKEVQTVTFYATSEDRFISSVDSLYLSGSLVGEDQALVWNEDHTVATWTGTLDLTGNKQFTIIKKCQVGETPHTYAHDFYTEEQTFDGDYNYGTFTLDLTTMTGTWGYVGLSFEDYATSNNTIIAEHDGHKANVVINRTIKATGEWFTLCLPFDMNEDKVFEVFGNSTIATLVSSEDRGSLIHLNFDYVKTIKAGKAYMIKPGKDFVAGTIIEGVTIKNVNPEDLKSTCEHMHFQGVFDRYVLTGDNKRFVSANNYLYSPADGGTTMGAFRCYFTIPVESQALVGSKAARIVFGPQVSTGTENVQSDQVQSTKVMINGTLYIIRGERTYNAQGQLVK